MLNANTYVHIAVQEWPTLYGHEVDAKAWQRVADHLMCTIGNGVDWDGGTPSIEWRGCKKEYRPLPDVGSPTFNWRADWYPFSRPFSGLFEPNLAPSFAKLAFRVLESVVSYGPSYSDIREARRLICLAADRYLELTDLYPALANADCVTWFSESWARTWINKDPHFRGPGSRRSRNPR